MISSLIMCSFIHYSNRLFFRISPICTSLLIQGRLERTETNLIHFKWGSSQLVFIINIFLFNLKIYYYS